MIYILLFFLILYLCSLFGGSKLLSNFDPIYNKYLYVWVFIGLFLLIGFRGIWVGTDTVTYVYDFLGNKTWSKFFANLYDNQEPLYTGLLLLCKTISGNYRLFLIIFGLPIAIAFSQLLKKFSDDCFLSTLIFSVLGIMYFSMAGLRQTVGMAFTLWAIKYAYERKPLPFILLCIIGAGFHNSALVFLIVYPFVNFKLGVPQWIAVAVSFLLGLTRNTIVLQIANLLIPDDRFSIYTDGTVNSSINFTMFFIQLLFFIVCYMFKNSVLEDDPKYNIFYNMAFLGLCLQALSPIRGEFFRVSMYFSIYLCILVPRAINVIKDSKLKLIAYLGICICGLAYTFLLPSSYVYTYYIA